MRPGCGTLQAVTGPDDDADDEFLKSAADDPTAVWDEAALQAAGVEPRSQSLGPATRPDVGGAVTTNVQVRSPGARARAPRARGISWPATLGLALAIGALVFFL